jgi:DNA-binding transcriptional LysR family regulator
VRLALETLEAAIVSENDNLSEVRKTLRLCMADSTSALVLPPLVRSIKEAAPNLTVQTLPLLNRDPRPSLLRSEIDLAIGSFPGVIAQLSTEQEVDSGICHSPLYKGEYVCVMRRGHPLADAELTLDRYCDADHVLVNFSGRFQGQVDKVLARLGRERRVILTVNQFHTVAQIVEASDLLSVMPIHLIYSNRMEKFLAWKRLPFELPPLKIDMLWHERDARDLSHGWVRSILRELTNADTRLSAA